ncbi:proline-rich protein 18 [Pseudophryne corroboree]|uniref:proline-rich protein 18 n=1 Tax=Pseudophryne corroboree TaxID=495146 RepID=UPI00308213F8
MSFPPILQHKPALPSRLLLSKAAERGAPPRHPSPLVGTKGTAMDKEDLSRSWPSVTLRRQLERRHRASASNLSQPVDIVHPARRFLGQVPRGMTRSYESIIQPGPAALTRARRELAKDPSRRPQQQAQLAHPAQDHMAAMHQCSQRLQPHPEPPQPADVHFSLCLTPESILVIQKRNFEKQLAQQQQRSAHSRRVCAGGSWHLRCPRSRMEPIQSSPLQRSAPDVSELVKISLLNEQHRYDDMEYEDECWLREGDEGLVRKCTEWLQGVEMAAGRDRNLQDKLQALPHLNTF